MTVTQKYAGVYEHSRRLKRLLKCTLPWNYLELDGSRVRMCGCGPHEEQAQDDPTAIDMYSEADISFSDYEAARYRLCLAVKVGERLCSPLPNECWELCSTHDLQRGERGRPYLDRFRRAPSI